MLNQAVADQISQAWISHWNQGNLEGILDHYADDIEFHSPYIVQILNIDSGKIFGKEMLWHYFNRALKSYPDLNFKWLYTLTGVESLILHYESVHRRLAAEFMFFNASQKIKTVFCHYFTPIA